MMIETCKGMKRHLQTAKSSFQIQCTTKSHEQMRKRDANQIQIQQKQGSSIQKVTKLLFLQLKNQFLSKEDFYVSMFSKISSIQQNQIKKITFYAHLCTKSYFISHIMFKNNNLIKKFSYLNCGIRKVLICPDKFKFSLSSSEVATVVRNSLPAYVQSRIITLADGGEGSLQTISRRLNGNWISCSIKDPLFRNKKAQYFRSHKNDAYIEMARASGLDLLSKSERSIRKTSTYGTGELILDSLVKGSKIVNILIGGSATNDGGIGCASALGFKFYDKNNALLTPIGQNLINIRSIRHEEQEKMDLLNEAKISVYTDVINPLYGINGASFIYGPQKGGSDQDVKLLDQGLVNLNNVFKEQFGIDANEVPGSGAAGGLGAGCLVLLKAQLLRGIDLIFQVTEFQKALLWADLVITGEGKFDGQTLEGKVVKGVIDRCLAVNKPVTVFCAICQQIESYLSSHPSVNLIQILNQQQKKTIDPEITRTKLAIAVAKFLR